jgi:peptidoglycan hydrolase-like protein with peptidoglycan-binding domain
MQGNAVTELQTLLVQQGFLSATPNGYFGPLTVAAVEKFQAAHGLAQLGVVGPATRAALNALLTTSTAVASTASAPTASTSTGSTGDGYVFNNFMGFGEDTSDGSDVLELQKRLATLGFFSTAPSGYFGSVTEVAVEKFQTAHGIAATGYVGSTTRAALNE